jgi:hypothetical protein
MNDETTSTPNVKVVNVVMNNTMDIEMDDATRKQIIAAKLK